MKIRIVRVAALVVALSGTPSAAHAQSASRGSGHFELNFSFTAGNTFRDVMLAALLSPSIAYVYRVGDGPYGVGGRAGFAWEWHRKSLKHNVFEAIHIDFVGRRQFDNSKNNVFAQFEAGPTLVLYHWSDDCGECFGMFGGVYVGAGAGWRRASGGIGARYGLATNDGKPLPERSRGILWSPYAQTSLSAP